MKKIGVAILGLGDVGGGTYQMLTKRREFYQKTQNVDIEVVSVLEKDRSRTQELLVPEDKIAGNIAEVAGNPDVNIVVECISDTAAAKEFVLAALNIGQTVVTSNKELYAKYSHELERVAKSHNAGLYYEASCYGGIPVVKTLLGSLQGNNIFSVMSTVNGGAEDAAYELSILSSLAFHTKVPYSKVALENAKIPQEEAENAKRLGYLVKQLAIGTQGDAGIEVRVQPVLVKKSHPLGKVARGLDAVLIESDSAGQVLLAGDSTGALPVGSAIISDILYIATHSEYKYSTFKNTAEAENDVTFTQDPLSAFYLRITAEDDVGALAKIVSTLGKNRVGVVDVTQCKSGGQKSVILLVTDVVRESAVKNAAEKINATGLATVEALLKAVC